MLSSPFPHVLKLISCALLLALAACGGEEGDAAAQGPGGRGGDRPVPVTAAAVRAQPWSDTIQALGTV
jgi:membrane fusion protein (multidrug efflux system)